MTRPDPDQPVGPSLLDRVMGAQDTPGPPVSQRPDALHRAVQRDLEDLLNSRRCCVPPPSGLNQLATSVVGYGLADFAGADVSGDAGRRAVAADVEATIKRFEPRLTRVRVSLQPSEADQPRTLPLRIEATLLATPAREPVAFASVLDAISHTFRVRSGADG